jgi:hypothetical protein
MCIIGVLSALVLPKLAKVLKGNPEMHERILKSYLGALAVGDVSRPGVVRICIEAGV